MNVVRAGHLDGASPLFPNHAPAHGQGDMDQLARKQSVLLRCVGCDVHNGLDDLRPSYQYMSEWAMYARNRGNGYEMALLTGEDEAAAKESGFSCANAERSEWQGAFLPGCPIYAYMNSLLAGFARLG